MIPEPPRDYIEHIPNEKRQPWWLWWVAIVAVFGLAGCDDLLNKNTSPAVQCFSITPNTGNQPFSPILVDACEGKSWLLVRSRMGDKPEDGYTYHWMVLDKLDYTNPVLVSGQ